MESEFGSHVRAAVDGAVGVVTFSHPPLNYASVELLASLADALEAIDAETSLRATVLRSEGKAFCAGADLATGRAVGAGIPGASPFYAQAVRLFARRKPIVAAVQGPAVGAGLGLALAADFRVAAQGARFVANFVKLGFYPGFGLTHTLPRVIGEQRASLMLLTGRRIKAEEALAWGLADAVVGAAELENAALAMAHEIAENAPLSLEATRRQLRGALAETLRVVTDHENTEQAILRETEDFREGLRAVAERRPGRWAGR